MRKRLEECFPGTKFYGLQEPIDTCTNPQKHEIDHLMPPDAFIESPEDLNAVVGGEGFCSICKITVTMSETRNHVMMAHIKSPGFRCKHCDLEILSWHSEFKQMNRHMINVHPKAGPWQEEFEDLRKPHYSQLKDLLWECFRIEAREERKEVNSIKVKRITQREQSEETLKRQRKQSLSSSAEEETLKDLDLHATASYKTIDCQLCLKPIAQKHVFQHVWSHSGFTLCFFRCRVCGLFKVSPDEVSTRTEIESHIMGSNQIFAGGVQCSKTITSFKKLSGTALLGPI